MRVLGISAFYHDAAAALVEDGRIVAAAQEERFSRRKHDSNFPRNAIQYCLQMSGGGLDQVDFVAFYDKPFLKFGRLLETYVAFAPRGLRSFSHAIPLWIGEKLFQKSLLGRELRRSHPDFDWAAKLLFAEHHQSHAASAFFASPFDEAVVLTLDGVGEWATASTAIGRGNRLEMTREIRFPHSLGLLYSAFTAYIGFKVNSGEYKVMGLAPYGQPTFRQTILDNLIDVKPDGSFRLDLSYFDYCTGLRMTNRRFEALFGAPPRRPGEPLTERHMDLAASVQAVTEEVMLRLARAAAAETGLDNLCLAGGVALNCVANGAIQRDGFFEDIWIQPAAGDAGDAGGALGAALGTYYQFLDRPRAGEADAMSGAFLGPAYAQDDIEVRLRAAGAAFAVVSEDQLIAGSVDALVAGEALGWFQGRMEFGPRALGARSILGDARSETMQSALNQKIKYRESFRPFAPAVLREDLSEWFELDRDSPYMSFVSGVHPRRRRPAPPGPETALGFDKLKIARSEIPAVTHVDYSARIQTVHAETNPLFHRLLSAFKARTQCPVLVNTSFNVRGEPIVCTPEDAFRCFMGTEMETLAIGECILRKKDQEPALKRDYKNDFEPD